MVFRIFQLVCYRLTPNCVSHLSRCPFSHSHLDIGRKFSVYEMAQAVAPTQLHLIFLRFILYYCQYPDCTASDSRMIDDLERIWKDVIVVCSRWYPIIFLEGLRKTMKAAFMIAGVSVRIQIKDLLNTSLDRSLHQSVWYTVVVCCLGVFRMKFFYSRTCINPPLL